MAEELKFGLVISADGTAAIRTLDDLEDGLNDVDNTSRQADRSTSNTFDRIRQRAKGLGSALASAATKVTMFGGAFAGVVGIVTSSQLSLATEIKQFAQVANVNVEKFQELSAGAKLYGIEQDKLADILKDTNDKVGDFMQTGGGAMADFFEKIAPKVGVTKEMFKGLSGSDALQLYYTSLEKANVSQADMVFYLEAIASDATLLQPLLKNNGAEFDRLGKSAKDAGMIMSEVDIENASKIKGSINQMTQMFDGFKVAAFKAMMPTLLSIAEAFESNKEQIINWIGGFASNLSLVVSKAVISWQTLKDGIQGVAEFATSMTEIFRTPENAERLQSVIQAVSDGFNRLKDYASQTGDVINQVTDFFAAHQEVIIPLASGIGAAAGAFLLFNGAVAAWAAIGTAATAVTTAFGIAVGVATSPVTLILGAIAGLVAVGVLLYRNWDTIKAKATEVFNSLPGPVQEAFRNIKSVFTGIKDWAGKAFDFLAPYVKATMDVVSALFTAHWATIKGIFSTSFDVIKGVVSTGFNVIKAVFSAGINIIATVFNTGFNTVKTVVKTAFNAIKALAKGDIEGFKTTIKSGLDKLKGIAKTAISQFVDAFGTLGSKLLQIGRDAVQGLINGVKEKISGAIDVARNLASSVSDTVKNFFVIRSPSRLFKKFGEWLSIGLGLGIKGKQSEAVQAALNLAQNIYNAMSGIKKDIALFGKNSELASFDYDRANGMYKGIKDSVLNSYRNLIKAKEDLIKLDAEINKVNEFTIRQQTSLEQYAFETSLIGKQADEVERLRFSHNLLNQAKQDGKDLSEQAQQQLLATTQQIIAQREELVALRTKKQEAEKMADFTARQQSALEKYAFETSLIGKQADEVERLRFERNLLNQAEQAGITLSEQATQKIIAQREELIELRKQQQALQDNNWVDGLQSGFQSLSDGAKSLNETMQQATTGAFNKMSDSFSNFVATGKGSFKDLTASILQDISKMLIKFAMLRVAKMAVGMFEDGGAFAGSGLLELAKGGAFNNQGIQYYANGDIFNKPTAFRHAGGLGVMGEAGPEAVMPLTRGPNGKLGVQVFNSKQNNQSAGVVNQVKIDIHINSDGASADVQTTTQDSKQLAESLKAVVLQTLQNEIRPGGMLAPV
ncbi:phage tail tape measure C-terminal domain-containing protein [Psychrobacter sp. FDAARGOS_221]|uniref:phage tail tape measure C-terminal domain-containing protein n=1 Tax=Psychrobacter sp. FDAARGOS_221 TaxID=1975705 RepID=UPI000BB53B02|nr:phage tail tape measure C-terminal domain-containing protein [Psychrobacter sp. FDAARGOS_221]PNK59916.1 hypothetical protein A6J60_002825 [Psychrobacter sp. FDAARGOS_221]